MKKDMKTLLPVILQAIEYENGKIRIYPHGTSMLPMIRQGIDSVVLVKPTDIKLYDIVLFKKEEDFFCLHRVVKVNQDILSVCGDNQSVAEKINSKDVIAKVESWYREDTHIQNDDKDYIKYIKRIVLTRPFRRIKRKIAGR